MAAFTLRTKIIAGSVALILLMGSTLFLLINIEIRNKLENEIQKRGGAIARHLADASVSPILTENPIDLQLLVNSYLKNEQDISYVYVVNSKKEVLAHTFGKTFPHDLLKLADLYAGKESNHVTLLQAEDGLIYDMSALIQHGDLGRVHIGMSEAVSRDELHNILKHLSLYLAAVLCLAIIIAFMFATTITRPVAVLAEGVRRVGRGELDGLIENDAQDEIGQLAAAFNAMTENLRQTSEGLRNEIEERKLVAEELQIAHDTAEAANRAKTEFLANMSHEMRTPLSAIIGGAEYLEEAALTDDQALCLNMIHQAGNNLLVLTNDLIDLARIEVGHLELHSVKFSIVEMLENIVRMLSRTAHSKQLELSLEIAADLPRNLIGDQLRLQQVLVNLVGNALKFTADGSVAVSASSGFIVDDAVPVTFEVRDTGIGIDASKIEKIFETFTQADSSITRQYGGSGLGLTISRRLVDAMGGHLQVESAPGVGSSFFFTVWLRVAHDAQSEDDKQLSFEESGRHADSQSEKAADLPLVLLVDDALENRELIKLQLKKMSIILHEAVNGREALDMFEQNEYVLILMDVQMPIMDGFTAARMIRGIEQCSGRAKTPIVALTAQAYEADVRACIEAGCDGHIAKPFKKEDLFRCLAKYINESPNV